MKATLEYRDRTPDAASDTREGMERLLKFARTAPWTLTASTRDRALALGCDVTGVKFA